MWEVGGGMELVPPDDDAAAGAWVASYIGLWIWDSRLKTKSETQAKTSICFPENYHKTSE
jgi:hypothetical protein